MAWVIVGDDNRVRIGMQGLAEQVAGVHQTKVEGSFGNQF